VDKVPSAPPTETPCEIRAAPGAGSPAGMGIVLRALPGNRANRPARDAS